MRLEIKAILKSVEETVTKGDLRFQYVLLEKPIHSSDDGALIRTDYFPATIFNDKIDSIKANELINRKIECVCYLNSQESENDGKTYHNLRLKVHSMKAIDVKEPSGSN